MQPSMKTAVAIIWILAITAVGFATGARSVSTWALLAGAVVLPLIVARRWWSPRRQTMSESIQEVLR